MLSDQVRKAVQASGLSRYRIWQLTGIDQATLSRFIHGQGGLAMDKLDKIADLLNLNLAPGKPTSLGHQETTGNTAAPQSSDIPIDSRTEPPASTTRKSRTQKGR